MKQLTLLDDDAPDAAPARHASHAIEPADCGEQVSHLAARLDRRLRLGTSSWSFPGWAGLVYRADTAKQSLSRDGLNAYGRHPLLRTVGVDSGFYAPLPAQRLARWAAQVPEDFRFLVKAPASITDRFRRDAGGRIREPNPGFLDAGLATQQAVLPFLQGLGARAGVLLFQFPPLGGQITADPRRFAEDLYRFLKRLPAGPVFAVELRDAALLTPDLAAALQHGGAVPGLACHPRLPELTVQQSLFAGAREGPLVLRWLLRRNRGYDEARDRYFPFDRLAEPDPSTRDAVAAAVRAALSQGREVFIVVNNKAEGSSPLTLIELARLVVSHERPRE